MWGSPELTLLTPTRYMSGVTVHSRLSSDTHMSPSAGTLSLRVTRQRYLGEQTRPEGPMLPHLRVWGAVVQ